MDIEIILKEIKRLSKGTNNNYHLLANCRDKPDALRRLENATDWYRKNLVNGKITKLEWDDLKLEPRDFTPERTKIRNLAKKIRDIPQLIKDIAAELNDKGAPGKPGLWQVINQQGDYTLWKTCHSGLMAIANNSNISIIANDVEKQAEFLIPDPSNEPSVKQIFLDIIDGALKCGNPGEKIPKNSINAAAAAIHNYLTGTKKANLQTFKRIELSSK